MAESMTRFQVEFRRQMLQLVGHWSYWIIHLVFALILKLLFWDTHGDTPEYILTATMGTVSAGLLILIAMLVSGLAAARPTAARFSELLDSYPVGAELIAAGWLASTLAALGFLLEPVILAGLSGSFNSLLNGLNPFIWYGLAGVCLGSSFTWWLASLVKFRRWVFPVLVAVWAAFWIGPMFLNRFGVSLAIIDLPTRMQNADFDPSFGRLEPAGLAGWMCLALTALAIFILLLALSRVQRARFHHPHPIMFGVTGLSILMMVSATLNFYITLNDLRQRAAKSLDGQNMVAGLGQTTARRYDVELDLSAATTPHLQVTVQIENTGDTVVRQLNLALFHGFEITAASLPYKRDGNRVSFDLPVELQPGTDMDLTLAYKGELATYMEGPQIPVALEFLQTERGKVGLDSQWLPVVGESNIQSLTMANRLSAMTAFRLTIKSLPGNTVYCNLTQESAGVYSSAGTDWVYLQYSPRMVSQTVEGALVVGPSDSIQQLLPGINRLSKYRNSIRAYFPDVPARELTILIQDYAYGLPSGLARVTDRRDLLVEPSFLLASIDDDFDLLDARITGLIVHNYYSQLGHETVPFEISNTLARFLWAYQLAGEDTAEIGKYMAEPNAFEVELTRIAAESGVEGVRAAVAVLAATPERLTDPDAIAQWLRESYVQN